MFFATASLVFETRSVAARWKDAKPSLPEYKLTPTSHLRDIWQAHVCVARPRTAASRSHALFEHQWAPSPSWYYEEPQTNRLCRAARPSPGGPSERSGAGHLMLNSIWKWMFCVCSQLVCAWRTPGPARSLPSESFSDASSICLNIMMAAAKRNEHLSEGANTRLHIDGVHVLVHPWLFQSPALI